MDRRRFLGVSGVGAASPMLSTLGTPNRAKATATLFKSVNFASDGLGLSSAEYAALLGEVVAEDGFEPDYYSTGRRYPRTGTQIRAVARQGRRGLPAPQDGGEPPRGTQIAGDDHRVLVQAESHLYNDSGDCAQTLSGLNLVTLAE